MNKLVLGAACLLPACATLEQMNKKEECLSRETRYSAAVDQIRQRMKDKCGVCKFTADLCTAKSPYHDSNDENIVFRSIIIGPSDEIRCVVENLPSAIEQHPDMQGCTDYFYYAPSTNGKFYPHIQVMEIACPLPD